MKIPIPVLSAIETALNAWLKLDGESLQKCEALEGKIIRLHITGLELNLFFLPAVSGIQVMSNYPDRALADEMDDGSGIQDSNQSSNQSSNQNSDENSNQSSDKDSFKHSFEHSYQQKGEVDATIHGSPMALMRLTTSENSGASMLEGDVEIDGDMRVAEKFSAILKEVDIDWEELLSKLVGDIVAHQAGEVVRSGSDWFKQSIEAMKLNTSEYLSEETKVTPADAELDYYMDQVDELRMDVDRIQARINNIQSILNND